MIAPACGVKRSTFFDTMNERGVEHQLPEKSNIIFDATVRLGATPANQTKEPVRLVAYEVETKQPLDKAG